MSFDSAPNYIFLPLAAERIFRIMPNVKLIALLRNPVERAVSHYYMSLWKKREHLPPLDAFQVEKERIGRLFEQQNYNNVAFYNNSYLSKGRYAEQIERYLQFFPIEQILLLPSESFFADPAQTLRLVFDFIGVDANYKIEDLAPQNVSKKPKLAFDVYEYLEDYFREHNRALYELVERDFGW